MLATIHTEDLILTIGHSIALVGVAVITLGLLVAGLLLIRDLIKREEINDEMRLGFALISRSAAGQ